jgi:hypothetical protein
MSERVKELCARYSREQGTLPPVLSSLMSWMLYAQRDQVWRRYRRMYYVCV